MPDESRQEQLTAQLRHLFGTENADPTGEEKNRIKMMAATLLHLTESANLAGAEGVFLVRGAKGAILHYYDGPPQEANAAMNFAIGDAELLVLIRFPAGDGGEPGVEYRWANE